MEEVLSLLPSATALNFLTSWKTVSWEMICISHRGLAHRGSNAHVLVPRTCGCVSL